MPDSRGLLTGASGSAATVVRFGSVSVPIGANPPLAASGAAPGLGIGALGCPAGGIGRGD